eukprot:PLAT12771.1.p1 GENE.PLAT12771.1~~PLAT12771.1.p1  ORF type:complete len:254 (-),score=50.28 PLAT12771.1:235-975(-)
MRPYSARLRASIAIAAACLVVAVRSNACDSMDPGALCGSPSRQLLTFSLHPDWCGFHCESAVASGMPVSCCDFKETLECHTAQHPPEPHMPLTNHAAACAWTRRLQAGGEGSSGPLSRYGRLVVVAELHCRHEVEASGSVSPGSATWTDGMKLCMANAGFWDLANDAPLQGGDEQLVGEGSRAAVDVDSEREGSQQNNTLFGIAASVLLVGLIAVAFAFVRHRRSSTSSDSAPAAEESSVDAAPVV